MTLTTALNRAFADTFAMFVLAAGFHWNVEGDDFWPLHGLFGEIYGEVYGSIDSFAEHIRAVGPYAPGSLAEIGSATSIGTVASSIDPDGMVIALSDANDTVLTSLSVAFGAANVAGYQGLMNFLADRLDAHAKHRWMLRATMS